MDIITSSAWESKARERLEKEFKAGGFSARGKIMAPAVKDALLTFAGQKEEFAQAIAQGGSLQECMKAVEKGVVSSISDLEAYKRAAAFYFHGARVRFQMTIEFDGDAPETANEGAKTVVISLEDFL